MERLAFTIRGNPLDPNGNAIPYTRTTQRAKYSPRYERYRDWKDYVVAAFYRETGKKQTTLRGKPIAGVPRASLSVAIAFKGEAHADPDNVVKGIADALFDSDKEVDVHTTHTCKQQQGLVSVIIEI